MANNKNSILKGYKGGIPVVYPQGSIYKYLDAHPNESVVLDEVIVKPYNKIPAQSKFNTQPTNKEASEKADEYVDRVTPKAEDLFNIGALGGLNNLSPTQWGRRTWDGLQLLQGKMPLSDYMNSWFYGNNGLVSDNYAKEHPYASAAINFVGDVGTFGTLSALRKLPKYAALMEAENRAAQEATALNWRDMLSGSARRTRIGDVEIDNPLLNYRQGDAAMGADFLNTGIVTEKGSYKNPMFNQGRLFYGHPIEHKGLLDRINDTPTKTHTGRVFLLTKPKDLTPKSDLLVSDAEMRIANHHSNPAPSVVKKFDEAGNVISTSVNNDARRIPYTNDPATSANTTLYRWEPGYGYKKVNINDNSYIVGNDVVDSKGNLIKSVDSILEDIRKKYPYIIPPEELTNKGFGKITNLSEHIQDVVKSAQEYPLPEGVSRKDFVTAALYHDLGKVFADYGHGVNSAFVVSELGFPLNKHISKAISSHMNAQEYFSNASLLEKALHATDVGRGMSYEELVNKYPYLKYKTSKNTKHNIRRRLESRGKKSE